MRNKWLPLCIALVLLLSACKQPATPAENPAAATVPPQTAADPTPGGAALQNPASGKASLVLTDLAGAQVEVISKPQKVISLSPAVTEIFYALDIGGALIGVDEQSDYPESAASLTKTATLDAVIAAQPEVVFVGQDFKAADKTKLTSAGICVAVGEAKTYADIYTSIAFIAQIMDVDAAPLVQGMMPVVQEVFTREFDFEPVSALLVLSDGKDGTYRVAGGASLFSDMIGMLSSRCITESANVVDSLTKEQLMELQPQVVLLASGLDFDQVVASEAFAAFEAVKAGRVFPIDDALVNRAGPRAVDGFAVLYDALEQAALS